MQGPSRPAREGWIRFESGNRVSYGCDVGLPVGWSVGSTLGLPVGCVVFAGVGCELGLPAGCEAGALPGWVASRLVQKVVTLSLPPAAVISAVKAGLSSALPGLWLTCAVYAWQSPRSDGDGLAAGRAGWLAEFPLAAGM